MSRVAHDAPPPALAGSRPPRVVIVDVHASDSLREFACALRHRGVDVVHLRPSFVGRAGRLKQRVDAWGGRSVPLPLDLADDDPQSAELRRLVLGQPTADVHATEPVLAALSATSE